MATEPVVDDDLAIKEPEKMREILRERKAKLAEAHAKAEAAAIETSRLRAENDKYKQDEADRQKKVEEEKRKTDEEKLKAEGKFEEAAKERVRQATEPYLKRIANLEKKYIPKAISDALVKTSIVPKAIPDVSEFLQGKLSVDPETADVYVKDDDGKPLTKDGKVVTVDAFVKEYVESRPHFKSDKMISGQGVGPGDKGDVSTSQYDVAKMLKDGDREGIAAAKEKDPEGWSKAYQAYMRKQRG